MIDAQTNEVVQIRAAKVIASWRAPCDAQRLEPVFERFDDLPRRIFSPANGNDAIVTASPTLDVRKQALERRLAFDPVDRALLLDRCAVTVSDLVKSNVR